MDKYLPVAGNLLFGAVRDKGIILLAANTRITKGVLRGIFRAAKETDSAVIFELARSECNLQAGYTGLTPAEYARRIKVVAAELGFDAWALHADHTTVKTGSPQELEETKELLAAQIDAGYTSFAIDASYMFDFEAKDTRGELARNIEVTTELAKFIEQRCGSKNFGLEVEVGEIGKRDTSGMVLTTPDEAVTYINALYENAIEPDVLAIANGSTHGNIFDAQGNPIAQVSIDIDLTKRVAEALRSNSGSNVRIAQHGITGTPLPLIATRFPHGDIIKGNVGTLWMNIVWEVLELFEPELFRKIWNWTLENYTKPDKRDIEIFGKSSKYAIKVFFDEIYAMSSEAAEALEASAYYQALQFFYAFKAAGSASLVREK